MAKNIGTILKKVVREKHNDKTLPERTRYYVLNSDSNIANQVYAQKFNERDYLIIDCSSFDDEKIPLAIVNDRHTDEQVLTTLYEQALVVATWRAKLDNNSVSEINEDHN
jgi:hypothetical protein